MDSFLLFDWFGWIQGQRISFFFEHMAMPRSISIIFFSLFLSLIFVEKLLRWVCHSLSLLMSTDATFLSTFLAHYWSFLFLILPKMPQDQSKWQILNLDLNSGVLTTLFSLSQSSTNVIFLLTSDSRGWVKGLTRREISAGEYLFFMTIWFKTKIQQNTNHQQKQDKRSNSKQRISISMQIFYTSNPVKNMTLSLFYSSSAKFDHTTIQNPLVYLLEIRSLHQLNIVAWLVFWTWLKTNMCIYTALFGLNKFVTI